MSAFQWAIVGLMSGIAVWLVWFIRYWLPRQPVDRAECPIEAEFRVESIRAELQDDSEPARLRSGGVI